MPEETDASSPDGLHYLEAEFNALLRDPATVEFLDSGALDGLWYWDLDNPEHEWMSPGFWRTLGFDPAEKEHLASEWQDLIYPEDRELALKNFADHVNDPSHPYDQLVRYHTADGGTVTVRCRGLAIREDGVARRLLGAHTVVHDTRKNEIDRQLSEMLELSQDAIFAWSTSRGIVRWNRGAAELYGCARDKAIGADPMTTTRAQWPGGWAKIAQALETDGQWTGTVEHQGADERAFYTSSRLQKLEDKGSGEVLIMQIDRDITAQRAIELELRAQQRQESQMLDGVSVLIGVLEPDGRMRRANKTAHDAARTTDDELRGMPFDQCPWWRVEDFWLEKLRDMMQAAGQGAVPRADLPWTDHTGARRWVDFQISPVRDEDGKITALIPSGVDITERKAGEAQRELITAELDHRVKNNLAIVRSIARQTFGSDDPRAETFSARLQALGKAHDMLTSSDWLSASLHELLQSAIQPEENAANVLILDSPTIQLFPQPARSFSLAFHELYTNALKHGALSVDGGSVTIGWEIADNRELYLTWRELGGPAPRRPEHVGFGTLLIERTLASDLQGKVTVDYAPGGLGVTVRAPLKGIQSG
ncbi:MAG: HWE histidine kinase domain-containing protein [Pseudomonadota bacterium]